MGDAAGLVLRKYDDQSSRGGYALPYWSREKIMKKFAVAMAVAGSALAFGATANAATATWDIRYVTPSNGIVTDLQVVTSAAPDAKLNFNNAAGLAVANGGIYLGGQYVPDSQLQGYSIQSITGTRTIGSTVTQITMMYGSPGSVNQSNNNIIVQSVNNYIYDNVSYNTSGLPVVDVLGLEYTTASTTSAVSAANLYNFYSTINNGSGQPGYMENVTQATLLSATVSGGIEAQGPVSAVPVPAALPMFASGLLGLGVLGRRRLKKAA